MKREKGTSHVEFNIDDNGGRSLGFERRQFSYSYHIPERRETEERRNVLDQEGSEGDLKEDTEKRATL